VLSFPGGTLLRLVYASFQTSPEDLLLSFLLAHLFVIDLFVFFLSFLFWLWRSGASCQQQQQQQKQQQREQQTTLMSHLATAAAVVVVVVVVVISSSVVVVVVLDDTCLLQRPPLQRQKNF